MSKITIDTNIFEHLLNPEWNPASHIDALLNHLTRMRYMLVVDSTKKIANEYLDKIIPMIRNMDETRPQLPILRYWMSIEIRHEEQLNPQDRLMQRIRQVIREIDEHADRAFVYVACKGDCFLITNDNEHILNRRDRLRRETRKLRGKNTDFIDSHRAVREFIGHGAAPDR